MRVVLDTKFLLSALINPHGVPADLIVAWREQRFALVTSIEQLVELGDVARRPVLRARIVPARELLKVLGIPQAPTSWRPKRKK